MTYDTEISHTVLSQITDRIIPEVKAWQNGPLEPVYCIVWLDAMHYKVRDQGKVVPRAVYNIIGINRDGMKEVLGMYVSESEGANFRLRVLTDLHNRGMKDVLIACTDNLKGFSEAIRSVSRWPRCRGASCIGYAIRSSTCPARTKRSS